MVSTHFKAYYKVVGLTAIGGAAPLVFAWLIRVFHRTEAPACYVVLCALLTLMVVSSVQFYAFKSKD